MNFSRHIRLPLVIATLFCLSIPGSAQNFSLTGSFTRLGTQEKTTRDVDGMKLVFPSDQDDLIELIEPILAKFREVRKVRAKAEGNAFPSIMDEDVREKIVTSMSKLLAVDSMSDGFDEQCDELAVDLAKVGKMWETWSGDLSEFHFWNHATVSPFWTDDKKALIFEEVSYLKKDNNSMISFQPPFIDNQLIGIGAVDLNPKDEIQPLRLDFPLVQPPGKSAREMGESTAKLLVQISKMLSSAPTQLTNRELFFYISETLLRHEVKAHYFQENDPPDRIIRALARLHLFILAKNRGPQQRMLIRSLMFQIPDSAEESDQFFDALEKIDPLAEQLDPDLEEAASRMIMYGLLQAAQKIEDDGPIFQVLKRAGTSVPEGGFNKLEFLTALRKTYPDFDSDTKNAKTELTKLMRQIAEKRIQEKEKKKEKDQPEPKKETQYPDNYLSKEIGNYTFRIPDELEEFIEKAGPEIAEKYEKANQKLQKRLTEQLVDPVEVSEEDRESLRKYGLQIEDEAVDLWVLQAASLANYADLFFGILDGDEIAIWFKEDVKTVITAGGYIENVTFDTERNKAIMNLGANFKLSEVPENPTFEDIRKRYRESAPNTLPVVIKRDEFEKQTFEENKADLLSEKQIIGIVVKNVETLTSEDLTGEKSLPLGEAGMYFLVVHELIEGDLIRSVIASPDRRWFCDGLANAIAIRECDRRFGKGKGMEVYRSMFPEKKCRALASDVDLLAWPAVGDDDEVVAKADGLTGAHYFFATEAMLAALEGRDDEFITSWISEIRKTRWVRTNANTVIKAYDKLAGDTDLRKIIEKVAKSEGGE